MNFTTFIWQNILSTLLKCLNLQTVLLKIRGKDHILALNGRYIASLDTIKRT